MVRQASDDVMKVDEMVRRQGRVAIVLLAGVVGCGLLAGSQATAAPLDPFVLATGQQGHAVSAVFDFGAPPQGPTANELVVGRPGSTDEIDDDAHLPPTAVWRLSNQLGTEQNVGTTSLAVRFTPDRSGDYPVFVFAERSLTCSGNMEDAQVGRTITQVGLVRIR